PAQAREDFVPRRQHFTGLERTVTATVDRNARGAAGRSQLISELRELLLETRLARSQSRHHSVEHSRQAAEAIGGLADGFERSRDVLLVLDRLGGCGEFIDAALLNQLQITQPFALQ